MASALLPSPTTMNKYGAFAVVLVAFVLFAECGLLIGFFLPGDTLLFSFGLWLATGELHHISLLGALVVFPVAAIVGNIVGYWIGRKTGHVVFHRPQSKLFKPEYVTRSHAFFEKYGKGTVIVARFVPIVRTVATVMAGVSEMSFTVYVTFSVIGGILWADGVTLLGYWLGQFKFVQDNIAPRIDVLIVGVVVIAILPTAVHIWRSRGSKNPAA